MYCYKCGTKNNEDGLFCTNCGVKLAEEKVASLNERNEVLPGLKKSSGFGLSKFLKGAAWVLISLLVLSFAKVCGKEAAKVTIGNNKQVNVSEIQKDLNKDLPRMLDDETRLDSIVALNNDILYRHTLVNLDASAVDVNVFVGNMKKYLSSALCGKQNTRDMLDKNYSYRYEYCDRNGVYLCVVGVTKTNCGN